MKIRSTLVVAVWLGLFALNGWLFAEEQRSAPGKSRESWITFLSHRTGRNLLYKMKPDGSQVAPIFGGPIRDVPVLVEGVTLYRDPHWTRQSPNRKYFAGYVYDRGIPFSKHQGASRAMLHVGGLAGEWSRVLNPDCEEEFAWSPDSTRIAFAIVSGREGEQGYLRSMLLSTEILVAGIDGSNEDYLLEQPGIWQVCDWSPDGKRLLLNKSRLRENPQEACDLVEFDLAAALAARDAFVARAGPGGKGLLPRGHEWPVRGAAQFLKRLLAGSSAMGPSDARYSPDGKCVLIAYADQGKKYAPNECAQNESGRFNMLRYLGKLAVLEITTGQMKTMADYPDGLRGPICWSPDGKEILFSRYLPKGDDREQMEYQHGLAIWAIGKDGKGARFLTTGWSPDWR